MKFHLIFLFICIALNATAQLNFLNQNSSFLGHSKSGFEKEELKNTTLLVETFEKTGKKCKNKDIIVEYGFHTLTPIVFHCPHKKMSIKQKKEITVFNNQLEYKLEKQKKIWENYDNKYLFISKETNLSTYGIETHRFQLNYQYVIAFNEDKDSYYAIRYHLYDRLEDKKYLVLEILDADTDRKELNNLEQVIKHLNN